MPITMISASLLGMLLLYLSNDVSNHRRRSKTSLGQGDDPALLGAIRAQANLIEYAPTGLILIGLLEYASVNTLLVTGLAVALVISRYIHGLTLARYKGPSVYRVVSTGLTWLVILVASIAGLIKGVSLL